jgi:hypothetical protein
MGELDDSDSVLNQAFYADTRNIIIQARENAARDVESARVTMCWRLGERIFVEEQRAQDRAVYGEYLIKMVSQKPLLLGISIKNI